MKYAALLFIFILVACGGVRHETITRLLTDQKLLKDSANNITERIGKYVQKGIDDSAKIQAMQLEAVRARLIGIQSSIDSRSK